MTTTALQGLFSDDVVVVESRDLPVDESDLWPDERSAIGDVVPGRWWDWVMGRSCARRAMTQLGVEPEPVLSGKKREPLWPVGVVGAITHTDGYVAAAVARRDSVVAVGIDAEPDLPLPKGVLSRIALETEHGWLGADPGSGVANPDRLLFSIKESIYKAWYPLAGRWLGFDEASVAIDAAAGTFRAEVLTDGPLSIVEGRFVSAAGVLLTAIEVSAD